MINNLIVYFLALVSPFFLWPVELLLPYPYLLEELIKGAIVYVGWPYRTSLSRLIMATTTGTLFAISESVLYLTGILQYGSIRTFWIRLLLTIPLHAITSVLILLPGLKKRPLMLIGLPLAILVHLLYNILLRNPTL